MKLYEIIAHIDQLQIHKLKVLKEVIDVMILDKIIEETPNLDIEIPPLEECIKYEKPKNY